jgi:hypothetical protein
MVLFWPIQQELDCINGSGRILGKIKFDACKNRHIFYATDQTIDISSTEKSSISERLAGLDSGKYSIPMQDDD